MIDFIQGTLDIHDLILSYNPPSNSGQPISEIKRIHVFCKNTNLKLKFLAQRKQATKLFVRFAIAARIYSQPISKLLLQHSGNINSSYYYTNVKRKVGLITKTILKCCLIYLVVTATFNLGVGVGEQRVHGLNEPKGYFVHDIRSILYITLFFHAITSNKS